MTKKFIVKFSIIQMLKIYLKIEFQNSQMCNIKTSF